MLRIFDFDGTIVDLWPRYHKVFVDASGIKGIGFDEYKQVKRNLEKDELVAGYFGGRLPSDYFEVKKQLLEEEKYLEFDKLLFEKAALDEMLESSILLSKRRNQRAFYNQISALDIKCKAFAVSDMSKKSWVADNIVAESVLMIGDSKADLEVGSLDNVSSWMVGYGIAKREAFDKMCIPYTFFTSPGDLEEAVLHR